MNREVAAELIAQCELGQIPEGEGNYARLVYDTHKDAIKAYIAGEEIVLRIGDADWRVETDPEFLPEFEYQPRSLVEDGTIQDPITPATIDEKFDYIFLQLRKIKMNLIITSVVLYATIIAQLIVIYLKFY